MGALGAEFIAMPGHKGLLGPQGTGLLLCGDPGKPLLFGGTGTLSREKTMPEDLPERLEAGTVNVPGAAGLAAGIRLVRGMTPEKIFARGHGQTMEFLGSRGIAVRAGLHCAPLAHESAGTLEKGTVRISFGHDASPAQTNALLRALGV